MKPNRLNKKAITIIVALVVAVAAALLVYAMQKNTQPVAKAVAYDNPLKPDPNTQLFDMSVRDFNTKTDPRAELLAGPKTIRSVVGGAFKLNMTIYGNDVEYDFYVEGLLTESEIDEPAGKDKFVGQIYLRTDKKGTFAYGIYSLNNKTKRPIGNLIVK